jgi:hypothetical protein
MLPELCSHVPDLVLGLVSDAAHPETERPQRGHRAASGQRRVFGQDLPGAADEHEQVEVLVACVHDARLIEGVAEVEGDRCAGMDEHAVAGAAQKEGDWLVHPGCLRAHRVAGVRDDFLAPLVQAGERLAGAEQLFIRQEPEARRDVAAQVAGPPDEREGHRLRERPEVAQVLRAGQQPSRGVEELQVPGIPHDAHAALRAGIRNRGVGGLGRPRTVTRGISGQHQRWFGGRRRGARADADAHRARAHERDREGQDRVLVVLRARELVGLAGAEPEIELVERKTERAPMPGPLQRARPGGGVEAGDSLPDEIHVLESLELAADVRNLAKHLGARDRRWGERRDQADEQGRRADGHGQGAPVGAMGTLSGC